MSGVEWVETTLGDACEMYQPETITGKQLIADGAYPVYGANGIIGRYNKFNHAESQLLITCRGATCGSVNVSAPKSWVTGNAMVVRPKNGDITLRFLEYLFRGGIDIARAITGAAQPQITRANLNPIPIRFPASLSEQRRIVGILDEAFAGIATAKANAEKNLRNARALFENERETILREKTWKWTTIGALCDDVEYGSSAKSKKDDGIPVLRMGNIQDGRLDWESLVYTNDKAEVKKYLLKQNDVLFNRTNSPELVGKTAVYKSERPAIFAGYLIRLHCKEELLDADYLCYFLNSQIAFDYGKTIVISSVNQANINGTKLKGYPIPAPSLSEQQAIVAKLDSIRVETQRLASLYHQKLAALDALKKSLLHQAFSAQLGGRRPSPIDRMQDESSPPEVVRASD